MGTDGDQAGVVIPPLSLIGASPLIGIGGVFGGSLVSRAIVALPAGPLWPRSGQHQVSGRGPASTPTQT